MFNVIYYFIIKLDYYSLILGFIIPYYFYNYLNSYNHFLYFLFNSSVE